MQQKGLLHKIFKKKSFNVHSYTLNNLFQSSEILIRTNKLNLSTLGRNFSKENKQRSNIKKIDRLLGNDSLQNESIFFYQALTEFLIYKKSTPWIHIDWSCISSVTNLYLLRASLSMSGRSIVIYEECHPKKNENNQVTHTNFLNNLKSILPSSAKPIIVTDAGFRASWFSNVVTLGWDFVGRIRNKNSVFLDSSKNWQLSGSLYKKATSIPTFLGGGTLTKRKKIFVNFILHKGKSKNRGRKNKREDLRPGNMCERYSKSHKEPWLLATTLESSDDLALKTVNIYRQRMRIEENFRDTKSTRFGFGLNECRTRSTERMKILLLIGAIATFLCWIAGVSADADGIASDFQVQSAKFKRSISIVYLGKEVLKRRMKITKKQFSYAIKLLLDISINSQMERSL